MRPPSPTAPAAATAAGGLLLACGGARPALSGAGEAAERISDLFWLLTAVGGLAFVLFLAALLVALFHRNRPADAPTPDGDRRSTRWIVWTGAVVPTFVLIPILLYTFHTVNENDPGRHRPDLVVEVVGKQCGGAVRYLSDDPAEVFQTANEIHVPVGKRVELRMRSGDVNHSFWIPELQGKTDLIPGRQTITWLKANQPGVYGGQCAEYCGLQHTGMGLLVVAQPAGEFEAWAAAQRRPVTAPNDSVTRVAQQVFLNSACVLCHAVRGTPARRRRLTRWARRTPSRPRCSNWKSDPRARSVRSPRYWRDSVSMPRRPAAAALAATGSFAFAATRSFSS